jgi:hypothetical protein
MPDSHKNFAYSTVATAPSPATSGTSLVVASGTGALFPTVPFNATIWPTAVNPSATNAEIVRVTAISTDTLTITRAQESTSARTVVIGDQISATITAKTLTDVEILPWAGKVAAAYGDGNPGLLASLVQQGGSIAPTPTNITTSVARICYFMLPFDLVVNKIRFFGVGAVTTTYRVALYKASDLSRLMAETSFTTAAATWGAAGSSLAVSLTKGTLYFLAVSVNATGTTAGVMAVGTTVAATTGQIGVAPTAWPGNLDVDSGIINGGFGQFAVTSGALPNPAATIAAQSAWTGGMPAFWLDNNNA